VISYSANEDFPHANTAMDWEDFFGRMREESPRPGWWDGPPDHPERDWFFRWCRASEAPGAIIAEFRRFQDTDVRAILPSVRVPVLVIINPDWNETHPAGDPIDGRYAAGRIPTASLVEVSDAKRLAWPHWYGRADGIIRETKRFLSELQDEEERLDRVLATVLFTDIVGSTAKAGELGDHAWRSLLEEHHTIVRAFLARFRGTEVDTAGDGFMATFDGPARAIRCAQSVVEALAPIGLDIRAGVHTGEVERIGGKVGGIAVNIAARVSAEAGPGEVLVSQTVRDLVAGSGLVFISRGRGTLKGVPDEWALYAVADD
jgi:class 3 adenylate cyclase